MKQVAECLTQVYIRVDTVDLETDEKTTRFIDHNSHEDRVWLAKHCFWAMRNNRRVTTEPVDG